MVFWKRIKQQPYPQINTESIYIIVQIDYLNVMSYQSPTKQIIRNAGIKSTINRVAVLECMTRENRPLSHSELVSTLGDSSGDQATIYRNLLTFVRVGILRVASQANGITYYELNPKDTSEQNHSHFVCQVCGLVSCLPVIEFNKPLEGKWKDAIRNAEVQFIGKCPECF